MILYRLVWYSTKSDYKYESDKFEYLGNRDAIWALWWILHKQYKYVEIYNMDGEKQDPERGIDDLQG